MADAGGQACAQVFVGLRQDLVLEIVEVDAALAVLVDDAFQQLGFLHRDDFEVRCELVLQLDLSYVAVPMFVKFVEACFYCEVEVGCKAFS